MSELILGALPLSSFFYSFNMFWNWIDLPSRCILVAKAESVAPEGTTSWCLISFVAVGMYVGLTYLLSMFLNYFSLFSY